MKKLILSFFCAFIAFSSFGQTCTPDTSYKKPGIFPPGATNWDSVAVMPNATVGMMYDEVAQMVSPSDTIIDTLGAQISATIDSIWLTDFVGLPNSITATCNTPDCFMVGGDNACIRFLGTPTANEVGNHIIGVKAFGYVSTPIGQIGDTIVFLMSIEVQPTQSVDENILSQSVKITPNPINSIGQFTFEVPDVKDYTFEIIDLTGKRVFSENGTTQRGSNSIQINRNQLSEGLYFYSIHWNGLSHKGRLMFID
ncbi:MAG: T9SS type A sorting domain-containing protein [Schleiferiaceae bacterium]|jgi:hypothetical protein|nr:T9SS type A sorting domain-containing protein [Schleiferiaceae bacterium]